MTFLNNDELEDVIFSFCLRMTYLHIRIRFFLDMVRNYFVDGYQCFGRKNCHHFLHWKHSMTSLKTINLDAHRHKKLRSRNPKTVLPLPQNIFSSCQITKNFVPYIFQMLCLFINLHLWWDLSTDTNHFCKDNKEVRY